VTPTRPAPLGHNRTLGERVHDALVAAAEKKADAMRQRRKADRVFDVALLKATGKNADERKASARMDPNFDEADKAALDAECAAIVAKAEADGLEVEFEQWRTTQANTRAEMNLR
jgi:hypothetical protein